MPSADTSVEPAVVSATTGRMRVRAIGFRHDEARAAAIEESVAQVAGVRAVQAYPRTASVVIWFAPGDCDTAAVLSAIASVGDIPATSAGARTSRSPVVGGHSGVLTKIVGGLLIPRRDDHAAAPEIERLSAALDRLGYRPAPAIVERGGRRIRWRWMLVAVPLGLLAVRLTGFGLHSLTRWAAIGPPAARSRSMAVRRPASSVAVLATSALAVPSWGGVVVSLLLVTVAGAIAHRQRLGLTREVVVAAGRAAVQLVTAGALLRIVFQRPSLLGPAGWLIAMVVVAGQVAGRRAAGLPQARVAATGGVAASTVVTLVVLLAGRVIAAEARVIVPVGGMIVSSAMLAAGSALRRLDAEIRQSRPAIEARLSLGQSALEAIRPYQRSALRTALIPAIDSTKVVGLISLPGAMTGLILAGISPFTAIRYQIVVMYMQMAGTALSALVAVRIAEQSLIDDAQRLIELSPPDETR